MSDELIPHEFQTGDILLYKGEGLYSKAIKFATKSQYSHVGIVLQTHTPEGWIKNEVGQALASGFTIADEGSYLNKLVTVSKVDVYRLKKPLTKTQQKRLIDYTKTLEGRPYDWSDILLIVLNIVTNKVLFPESTEALICSEAVSLVYSSLGIELTDKLNRLVTPDDISKSKVIEKIY